MKSKIQVKRSDLYCDACVQLDCAADLLYTVCVEHFGSINPPENWGDGVNYESLSRKIRAVSTIFSNALDMLSVAENDGASDYSNVTIKLMADIIRQSEERRHIHEKGGAA